MVKCVRPKVVSKNWMNEAVHVHAICEDLYVYVDQQLAL